MKRVAVVHHSWPGLGGGERLVVSVIGALNAAGIVPDVFTLRPVDSGILKRTFGMDIRFRYVPMRFLIPYHGYRLILYRKLVESMISSPRGYDVVFNCAIGEYSPISVRRKLDNHTLYVFNPFYEWPRRERGFRWTYSKLYRSLVLSGVRSLKGRILTNSNFTARRIWELWSVRAKVLYSPVDVGSFTPPSVKTRSGIINVGRFHWEKRQQDAIYVASRVKTPAQLTLVGSSFSPDTVEWLRKLRGFARLSSASVRFLPNLSFNGLREELWKAKVLLHTFPEEDQGLAPLEGIAAGCVPIVPDAGGNLETVPIRELRFRTLDEAVAKVEQALRGDFDGFLPQLRAHLAQFSTERFTADLLSELGLP